MIGLLGLTAIAFVDSLPVHAAGKFLPMGSLAPPAAKDAVLTDGIRVTATPREYGYIDRTGKAMPLPKAKFVRLCRFQEGLAAVEIRYPDDRSWGPGHWGFIDQAGRFVIPAKFQYACDFHEGLVAVNVGGRPSGGADPNPAISMVDDRGRHFVYPTMGGKWGFVDKRGEFVVQPIYDKASDFSEGLACVSTDEKEGYINKLGKTVIKLPSRYRGGLFSDGLAYFSEPWKTGYVNAAGERLYAYYIEKSGRTYIHVPSRPRGTSSKDWNYFSELGKEGYIDAAGKEAIPAQFSSAWPFSCGRTPGPHVQERQRRLYRQVRGHGNQAPVRAGVLLFRGPGRGLGRQQDWIHRRLGEDGHSGPLREWPSISPRVCTRPSGESVGLHRQSGQGRDCPAIRRGRAVPQRDRTVATAGRTFGRNDDRVNRGTWGYIDRTGKFVIPPQFDEALDFWEGKAVVTKDVKYGLEDSQGKLIIAPCYEEIGVFNEGLVPVRQNGRGGFVDPFTGRVVIPLRFEFAEMFSCGRAAVCEDDKWGFIDKSGNYIVKPQYSLVATFSEKLAAVSIAAGSEPDAPHKCGYIDTKGNVVIRPQFDLAENFSEGLAAVAIATGSEPDAPEKWGYVDAKGKIVIRPQFGSAEDFSEGLAAVLQGDDEGEPHRNAKWGFINKSGEFVIAPQFAWADRFAHGRATVRVGKIKYQVDAKGKLYEIKSGD